MSLSVDLSCLKQVALSSVNVPSSTLFASVNVDLDKSVFLLMALFSLLIVALKPLLFDPMLRVFALREKRTDGAKAEARKMQERAADILLNYEEEVAKVRSDATAERDELRKQSAQLESKILAEGRAQAEELTRKGRAEVAEEMGVLAKQLADHTGQMAIQIANKAMGREVTS